jgi:hypothetical protein
MQEWVIDLDSTSAATLMNVYTAGINSTYVAYTGSGTSGSASSFLNTNTNYVRIDGPRVWIEMVCQSGVVFTSQIHYHSVWRDHVTDYGTDLTSTTLPTSLLSFSAALKDGKRTITWTTTGEINMDHFEVEQSATGNNLASIGSVTASNNVAGQTYSLIDNVSTVASINYYRLKMVDKDGTVSYSTTASIKNKVSNSVSVYPNPASGVITLNLSNAVSNATVKITDNTGRLVSSSSNLSGNTLNVDVSRLATGSYYVQVTDASNNVSSKFIKK